MATDSKTSNSSTLSPEAAFSVLGNRTRLEILTVLGEADEPLSFSTIFERVDYDDSANFNYHLQQLLGHFVRETDGYYSLRHAGGRIVQAILSGTVTENPVVERASVARPCFLCGGNLELSYREERIALFCTDCGGTRGDASETVREAEVTGDDIVGGVSMPPAGIQNRSPSELLRAAEIRSVARSLSLTRDICPVCGAPVERSVRVCEDHDPVNSHCPNCDQRFGVTTQFACTNCILKGESVFTGYLLGDPALMGFMIEHGIDPIYPKAFHLDSAEETIHSVEPFEASFTFTADGEAITLAVDEDLEVIDVSRNRTDDAG